MKTLRTAVLLSILLQILGAAMARATSFVMVADRDLAAQAALVAEVSVVKSGPGGTARPATDSLVEIERVWKGEAPGSRLVVRVPGGVGADGLGLKIWGAPRFADGEHVLLFLAPRSDGTYGVLHLMLGAFHLASDGEPGGRTLALRDLSETAELASDGTAVARAPEAPRDLERFTAWIASGAARPADYWLPPAAEATAPSGLRSQGSAFVQLTGGDGIPIRWFVFDSGGYVNWKIGAAGQPGLGATASTAAFQAAMAAWNNDPTSRIDYRFAGTTESTTGLHGSDNVNALIFDDPSHGDVTGTFACATGGVIAMSGPYYYGDARLYHGRSYHEAFEADIVTNDGTDCFFQGNPTGAAEVFTHELGHTLGLGHSADPNATMWANAHNDGRGAHLGDDDRMAVNSIYGDGTLKIAPPPPPPPPAPTAGPAAIVLAASTVLSTEVDLRWACSNMASVDGFVIESQHGRTFRTVMSLPASATTAALHGLRRNSRYVLRLRARVGSTLSPASNLLSVRTPQ